MVYRDKTPIDPDKDYDVDELAKFIREKMYGEHVREALAKGLEKTSEVAEWSREVAQELIDEGFDEGALNTEIERKLNELEEEYAPKLTGLEEKIDDNYDETMSRLADEVQQRENDFERLETDVSDLQAIKVSKAELRNGLSSKVGKGENESITMSMLGTDIKKTINDGTWDVRVNTSDLENGSATFDKRTRLGEQAFIQSQRNLPNIENAEPNRRIVFYEYTNFISGPSSALIEEDVIIDLPIGHQFFYIFIDLKTKQLHRLLSVNDIASLSEDCVYVCCIFFEGSERYRIMSFDINSSYSVNGEEARMILGDGVGEADVKSKAITSKKRTVLGERAALICLEDIPDLDTKKRTLTFDAFTRFYTGINECQIPSKTTINLSESENHHFVFINICTSEFKVINRIERLTDLSEDDVYVTTISFVDTRLKSVDIGSDYSVNGELVSRSNNQPPSEQPTELPFFTGEPVPYGWYIASDFGAHTSSSHFLDDVSLEYIYQPFEKGLDDFPDYVSKEVLGMDESGDYEVLRYDLKPQQPLVKNYNKKIPKIIITGNIHGEEKGSSISLSNFVDDLLNKWDTDPLLEWIRFNLHLIIVPVNNPYGFVNPQKYNFNGVDLNRNFGYNWEIMPDTEPGDKLYRGPSPFSEKESRYIRDIIDNNLDAMAFYDYHMNGSSGDDWKESYWTIAKSFQGEYGHWIGYTNVDKINKVI